MFARALYVTRLDLTSGESDEMLGVRIGIAPGPVSMRREEVRSAIQATRPKISPRAVRDFLEKARRNDGEADSAEVRRGRDEYEKRAAWNRAAQIQGENPAKVRSARGFRVEWDHHGWISSQVGWTIVNSEVRSFLELQSR